MRDYLTIAIGIGIIAIALRNRRCPAPSANEWGIVSTFHRSSQNAMAFISLPDSVKIEIKMRKGGAPNVNIIWGRVEVTIDLAKLEQIALAVVAWWNAEVKPLVSSSTALESVTVTDWSVVDSIQHVETLTTPSAGTATGGDLPSNVAAVTTFYTGYTGRSFRGRVYNAGLTDAQVTTNTLGTTYVLNMLTAWAELNDALSAIDVTHVVASFQHDNAPRAEGVATPIIEYGMNNVVDTQRRRIPRVDS